MADEVIDYRDLVLLRSSAPDGTMFQNRNASHASIVFAAIFSRAEHEVLLLTGSLNDEVYGKDEVVQAVLKFLRRHANTRLRVLHEELIAESNHLLDALRDSDFMDERVQMRKVPDKEKQEYGFHFTVADSRHLRYEENRKSFEAVVQFGGDANAVTLSENFEYLWDASA